MKRVPTGVFGLDRLLLGGLPRGSMTLVSGHPGGGKSTIAEQFLYEGLVADGIALLASTSESWQKVKDVMLSFDWLEEKIGELSSWTFTRGRMTKCIVIS